MAKSITVRVAELLGRNQREAWEFCDMVQKNCKEPRPTFKKIYETLVKHPEARSIRQVAEIIQLQAPAQRKTFSKSSKRKQKTKKSRGMNEDVRSAFFIQQNILAANPQRVYSVEAGIRAPRWHEIVEGNFDHPISSSKKCPHGVPMGQSCALCDEGDFRFMTGID